MSKSQIVQQFNIQTVQQSNAPQIMKTTITKFSIFSLLLLVLVSCKKDAEMPNEFVNLKTSEATEITAISAVVNAVAKANCTERGVCWGKSSNPTIADFHVANGGGKGEYACTLTDLEPGQKYYYRAYGFDGKRYAYSKDEKEFVTKDGVVKVTTGDVTDITATSAKCSGEVTDDGGFAVTEHGICWSKNPNPTLDNAEHIVSGSGIGSFPVTLIGLEWGAVYYVRAYALNSNGTQFYGEDVSFTTLISPLTFTANGVSFKMLLVEGGTFTMGATTEQGSDTDDDEWPTHSVILSSYYMGETEVTQALWQAVMGSNPSCFNDDSQRPVEQVSWNDSQEFITKLNTLLFFQLNGRQFRLPTEAEWEYSARGGNQSQGYKYSGSNTVDDVAWYSSGIGIVIGTQAVGTMTPNELGLYDMSGNVWEWCSDWYDSYSSIAQTNPTGPPAGSCRVLRGGSWDGGARYCRVSFRNGYSPGSRINYLGLRLSLR